MNYPLHRGDQVEIYFRDQSNPPYREFGTFQEQDDDCLIIIGTVGDNIDKELIIPKSEIKMLEITERVSAEKRAYDEHWEK